MYDPVELAQRIKKLVVRGRERKYYRVARGGQWYGGIATADCVGCNLKCVFCWSGAPRDAPSRVGRFYTPEEVFNALDRVVRRRGYRLMRVSGNEPTIGWEHLMELLNLVEQAGYSFILETNGTLIGADKRLARDLSRYKCIHVRVSLKGASPEEFTMLTGAKPEAFELQLNALRHLLDYGVECHPAVMLSFSKPESIKALVARLREIDPVLVEEFESEFVFLYPHVVQRLKRAGVKPRIAFPPNRIPKWLV